MKIGLMITTLIWFITVTEVWSSIACSAGITLTAYAKKTPKVAAVDVSA